MPAWSAKCGLWCCIAFAILLAGPRLVGAQGPSIGPPSPLGSDLASDFKYFANNAEADLEDVVTSPLHVGDAGELLRSPRFYLVLAGSGAAFGGSFALDQTVRSHLRGMSSGDANLLEDTSMYTISAASVLLYAYGLYSHDARAREYMLTAGESAGLASLVVLAMKAGFGRLRPNQDHHDHDAFFHQGSSFVSGEVTPMFALAAGISEYYDNRWYVAAPVYSLALLDGFGRIGHDRHWLSDVIGSALLGVGTSELLLYLHRYHAEHPWRMRIFPTAPSSSTGSRTRLSVPMGATIALDW